MVVRSGCALHFGDENTVRFKLVLTFALSKLNFDTYGAEMCTISEEEKKSESEQCCTFVVNVSIL